MASIETNSTTINQTSQSQPAEEIQQSSSSNETPIQNPESPLEEQTPENKQPEGPTPQEVVDAQQQEEAPKKDTTKASDPTSEKLRTQLNKDWQKKEPDFQESLNNYSDKIGKPIVEGSQRLAQKFRKFFHLDKEEDQPAENEATPTVAKLDEKSETDMPSTQTNTASSNQPAEITQPNEPAQPGANE